MTALLFACALVGRERFVRLRACCKWLVLFALFVLVHACKVILNLPGVAPKQGGRACKGMQGDRARIAYACAGRTCTRRKDARHTRGRDSLRARCWRRHGGLHVSESLLGVEFGNPIYQNVSPYFPKCVCESIECACRAISEEGSVASYMGTWQWPAIPYHVGTTDARMQKESGRE